jgi:hypothetical protein
VPCNRDHRPQLRNGILRQHSDGLFEGVETAFGKRRTNAAVQGTQKQTHSVKEFGYSLEKHQSEVIRSLGIEAEFSYSFLVGGDVSA